MDETKRTLVQSWLIKAQHDLATARKVATDPDPYLDTAIYHCQQAGEKAVKGLLVFHDQRFEKPHDIRVVVMQAASFQQHFWPWVEVAERLTPYASIFRYPAEVMEPSAVEFDRALADATALYDFVLSLLPTAVHPPSAAPRPNGNTAQRQGEIESPDGIATVQDPICGDMMRITIRVKDGRIEDIKFKTLGCAAAVAASSITTELAKGKTLEEAKKITPPSVAEAR
ncbi:MAG: HEPN domain-containing protein, partial [Planctomycetes bacterium]|nr:HEPN domain-containing protein [Planctomycetota bacterium]